LTSNHPQAERGKDQKKLFLNPELKKLSERIVKRIDSSRVSSLTQQLVKIPSVNPPGNEKQVAEFIASWFDKRGFDLKTIESVKGRPNLEVKLDFPRVKGAKTKRKILILNGHMDVVPQGSFGWSHHPFGADMQKGRIYGRGSADMKGGVASMMIAIEEIKRNNSNLSEFLHGSIIFTAVVDEEIGGPIGTSYLVRERGLRGDFAIVGEPTNLNICTSHKGVITFDITTRGKSAHASVPNQGINAIMKMNKVITLLDKYSKKLVQRPMHHLVGGPTLNIGVISGGTKSNVVPDSCTISAERRVTPLETMEDARHELEEFLADVKLKDTNLDFVLDFKIMTGPSELGRNGKEGLENLVHSLECVTGKTNIKPIGFVGTCDAYFLSAFGRIPSVIFGPGSMSNIHKPNEYVEISDLVTASKTYAMTATSYLGN
jgi:succinyl-diaminopimelate desuccinylase